MRVLYFIESLRSGGKERRLLELIYYLKYKMKYEVHLVLLKNEIHYKYVYDWDIPITIIKRKTIKKDPRIFWKFYKLSKKFKPDVIHTWSIMNTFYAIPSKFLLSIPMISSMITSGTSRLKPWGINMFIFKTGCYFSNLITSNSKAGFKAFKVNPEKSRIVYNGVRLERFKRKYDTEAVRKKFNIAAKRIVIMVASMIKIKDYDTFLNIANLVRQDRDDIQFVGIGDGIENERLHNRIKKEGIDNVKFIGKQDDVESIIYAADIGLLFTNGKEGLSNAIMEYMSLKKPVIATDSGGTPELVDNENSGYLVVNKDLNDIKSKLLYLIDNPDIRDQKGQAGYNIIKEKFTVDKMTSSFIQLYKQLINE